MIPRSSNCVSWYVLSCVGTEINWWSLLSCLWLYHKTHHSWGWLAISARIRKHETILMDGPLLILCLVAVSLMVVFSKYRLPQHYDILSKKTNILIKINLNNAYCPFGNSERVEILYILMCFIILAFSWWMQTLTTTEREWFLPLESNKHPLMGAGNNRFCIPTEVNVNCAYSHMSMCKDAAPAFAPAFWTVSLGSLHCHALEHPFRFQGLLTVFLWA